jgi:uncharacterized membrane protein
MTSTVTAPEQIDSGTSIDRKLAIAILVLAVIGTGVASYLTYVHYEGLKVVCSNTGCATVQSSRYAKLVGIPVATLGLVGYLGILGSLLIKSELGRMAGFGIALIGFLFSLYLTYRELFTIHAICEWCVSSAVLMTLLFILTAIRALRYQPDAA